MEPSLVDSSQRSVDGCRVVDFFSVLDIERPAVVALPTCRDGTDLDGCHSILDDSLWRPLGWDLFVS